MGESRTIFECGAGSVSIKDGTLQTLLAIKELCEQESKNYGESARVASEILKLLN